MDKTIEDIVSELKGAKGLHDLFPVLNRTRIEELEETFGSLPPLLSAFARHFNGAELFLSPSPFITLFGVRDSSARWDLFPQDWFLDKATKNWRESGDRESDWAFGMTNYGGLLIMKHEGSVVEWDTGSGAQTQSWPSEGEWFAWLQSEGMATLGG